MTQIFTAFLLTSAMGTILALVLTMLKPVTRKIFSAGWHYYMWLAVLLVMLLPVRISLPQTIVAPVSEITSGNEQIENSVTPTTPQTETYIISAMEEIENFVSGKIVFLSYVWLFGAALIFLIKLIGYEVFLIKLYKQSEAVPCPEIKRYTSRKIQTRISSTICSPLMIGVFKPTLLLPNTEITPEQLHNILAHETTHLKRNDVLYKWLVSVVKCVHWFNPAIYLISKQISIDCEISCDLAVIREMDEQEEKSYIETILSLLTHNSSKAIPLTTGMTGSKEILKRRFTMIKNRKRIGKATQIISIITAIVILSAALLASGVLVTAVYEEDAACAETDFVWPTENKTVSARFLTRTHPITGEKHTHNGIDIAAPENSEVYSSISGEVAETGFDAKMGNYVIIQNDSGVKVFYGHLSAVTVSKGDKAEQGAVIGKVGKTGRVTGAFLHFEIHINGQAYNPELVLPLYSE